MRRAVLVVAAAVLAAGCGDRSPAMSDTARTTIEPLLAQVRAAAAAQQPDVAAERLAALRAQVQELHRLGEIDGARAAEILAVSTTVEEQLSSIATTTTVATTLPPTTTTSREAEPEEKPDEGRGGGKKKGKDNDLVRSSSG